MKTKKGGERKKTYFSFHFLFLDFKKKKKKGLADLPAGVHRGQLLRRVRHHDRGVPERGAGRGARDGAERVKERGRGR